MFHRKPLEQRIAERQAALPPLKEGKHFEHGPAKFVFIAAALGATVIHVILLVVVMLLG
ncbi:hypothetical protein [Bailinhaonella thermotolerans]|uniref:hypothetical protein n=1 Tax=Bailinhaonella thermotolerans TaxID=1070861 RepID=UPI00192A4CC3|nr:hypothetical protein [Bailinhaonella thermotolerans]